LKEADKNTGESQTFCPAAVFVDLPTPVHFSLQNRGWHYYTFIGGGGARFMCSWSTADKNVAELLRDCAEV
jgi:threonine aldolase